MKNFPLCAVWLASLLFAASNASAVEFSVLDLSHAYDARIVVAQCEAGQCSGPATVDLLDHRTHSLIQRFKTEDMSMLLNAKKVPSVNVTQLANDQDSVIIGDFNFDGQDDIAIRNGDNSSYGGPSYDVYVYNRTHKAFVPSVELTDLATSNLGMFTVDARRKRLIVFNKGGCCIHQTVEYAVVPRVGLQKVYEKIEASTSDGNHVEVSIRRRVNERWTSRTRTYRFSDYYKP